MHFPEVCNHKKKEHMAWVAVSPSTQAKGLALLVRPLKSWSWWCMSIIPAPRKMRQEDHEFKASLGYITNPLNDSFPLSGL
jgi:hypothetical protein